MDENVNPKVSPIYLGIWFATTFLGPGMGFAVGGAFLRTFTDLKVVSTGTTVFSLSKACFKDYLRASFRDLNICPSDFEMEYFL